MPPEAPTLHPHIHIHKTLTMNLAVFSAKPYDREYLSQAATSLATTHRGPHTITFHDFALSSETVPLARGADAVCVFVNDVLSAPTLAALHAEGVRAVLMRCAGYNNVDLDAAERLGLAVANVPSYSPEAVAEFAVALVQTLNRKTHRAYNRVREGNCELFAPLFQPSRELSGATLPEMPLLLPKQGTFG